MFHRGVCVCVVACTDNCLKCDIITGQCDPGQCDAGYGVSPYDYLCVRKSLLHLYPTSMWGRYGMIVSSMQLGRTPPLLTVPSLSDRLSHSPPTSSSVFLSCFLALLYPSPSFLRTPHLFSSHARTIASCVYGTYMKSPPHFVLPLIFSFLILSNLVTPHIHRKSLQDTNTTTKICIFH